MLAMIAIFMMSFFNVVTLDINKDEVKLDGAVLIKLATIALAGLTGFYGLLVSSRMRQLCSTGWMLGVFAFWVFYFLAACVADIKLPSIITAICLLAAILATNYSIATNGWQRTFFVGFAGVVFYCFCSIIFRLLAPEQAIFMEPLPEGEFAARMRGLSHPNTLGQYSGLAVSISLVLWLNRKISRSLATGIFLMGVVCLVGSLSRASMISTVVAIAFVYRGYFLSPRWLPFGLVALAVGCFAFVFLSSQLDFERRIEALTAKLSKSGDSEELTTATGRADIWAKTIELIAERPTLGYGPNTSKELLSDYSQYTHNMFLNVALSGGVMCLLLTMIVTVGRLWQCFQSPDIVADLILIYLLFNGMVENVIYEPIPAAMTVFWLLTLASRNYREPVEEDVDYGLLA